MRKRYLQLKAFEPNFPLITAVTGSALLGAAPIFVRLTDIGPNATGCYRILFALPLMWLWVLLEKKATPKNYIKPTKRDYGWMILAGFFFSLDLALWHTSIDLTSIINAAIFNNLTPIFVPLLVWAIYSQKPHAIYLVSVTLAIVGSSIVTGSTFSLEADNLPGDLLAITSALSYSGYIIVIKNLRQKYNTPTIMFWTGVPNLIFLMMFTYYMGEDYTLSTAKDWIGTIGLAIFIHVFGQGLLAYSMGQLSAAFISLTMLLGPIVAAILGWLVFGETLLWLQTLGALIVLSSIAVARVEDRKSKEVNK